MIGDHTHIFWGCPKLRGYWINIKKEMDKIFKSDISIDPQLALLDIIQGMNNEQGYLMHILLMVARKMITLNWMNPSPPTKEQWVQKLKQVYKMEHMTAQLQLKMEIFVRKWTPVIDYLEEEGRERIVLTPQV